MTRVMTNLQTLTFYATPQHNCSYLPNKKASTIFVDPLATITPAIYTELSQLGFRRSGNHYYRPHCQNCQQCIPLRIPVADFKATKSQRRILKKNSHLHWQIKTPSFAEDHYLLYEKYIKERHADGDMYPPSRDQYRSFLTNCHSSTQFIEFSTPDRLCAVAVVDQLEDGLSAIYTFFDPDLDANSLGSYAILWQIDETRRRGQKYLYLGYFVKDCRKMTYKSQFKPFEARVNERWLSEHEWVNLNSSLGTE